MPQQRRLFNVDYPRAIRAAGEESAEFPGRASENGAINGARLRGWKRRERERELMAVRIKVR